MLDRASGKDITGLGVRMLTVSRAAQLVTTSRPLNGWQCGTAPPLAATIARTEVRGGAGPRSLERRAIRRKTSTGAEVARWLASIPA